MTPFQALYGREPPTILTYLEGSSSNGQLAQELLERDKLLKLLKHNLKKAQTRMKLQVDKHHRDLKLAVSNWAFVKLQHYRQLSLRLQRHQKLGPRFFGPYQVLQHIGSVAYKLDLPDSTRIHPIFYISQLKPYLGRPLQQITPLPLMCENISLASETSNLEDKVSSPGGGNVTAAIKNIGQVDEKGQVETTQEQEEKKNSSLPNGFCPILGNKL